MILSVGLIAGIIDQIGQFISKEDTWVDLYTLTGFSGHLLTLVSVSSLFSFVISLIKGLNDILPIYFIFVASIPGEYNCHHLGIFVQWLSLL